MLSTTNLMIPVIRGQNYYGEDTFLLKCPKPEQSLNYQRLNAKAQQNYSAEGTESYLAVRGK